MKKRFRILFSLLMVITMLSSFGCANNQTKDNTSNQTESSEANQTDGKFKAGTYEGTGKGLGGTITATVTVTEDEITDIKLDISSETESIAKGAADSIISDILSGQGLAIDAVSGATISSNGILEAITAALGEAGADIEALKQKRMSEADTAQQDLDVDIVIIGAGGAGMAAAVEAKEAGKNVIIIEKMPIIGGNTNFATGGMNAAETPYQEQAGIKDSKDIFYDDTMKGGKNLNDPELLKTLVDNSAAAVEWVNDMGADLTRVTLSGGATNPRIHTPADGSPVGPVIVKTLSQKLEELDVDILLNTTAKKIIAEDGVVTGIEATDKNNNTFTIHAKAVILATGGFGANSEMVVKYRPDLVGFSTTNHKGATGEGIVMAEEVGADLTDIGEIQIHPTTHPETGYMFTEGLRGDGAILVNVEGKRFTDELLTRDVVSANILKQTDGIAYLITNETMREENASLASYIEKGYAVKAETVSDLATALNMDSETFETTMKDYVQIVKDKKDPEFGREHLTQTLEEGPYYAIKVTPGIHHTMGGLKIDTKTHVINKEGNPISGFYAAGEIAGGIHGGNRIGGNAVVDIIVYGRIAGQTAASEIK